METAKRKRILVADDDPEILELVFFELQRLGYEVMTAEDGQAALKTANAAKPDLVLTDVMMPFIDGYHLASELTSRRENGLPRVIIMTARSTEREKGVLIACGADGALQKPFNMEDLEALVARTLEGA